MGRPIKRDALERAIWRQQANGACREWLHQVVGISVQGMTMALRKLKVQGKVVAHKDRLYHSMVEFDIDDEEEAFHAAQEGHQGPAEAELRAA